VLPAVLRAHGVLKYSAELAAKVDGGQLITNREEEAAMRAAAVVACERIVRECKQLHPGDASAADIVAAAASSGTTSALSPALAADSAAAPNISDISPPARLTALDLDYHLWLSGKEPELRKLPRHATRSIYY
jgi:hypothetical protein